MDSKQDQTVQSSFMSRNPDSRSIFHGCLGPFSQLAALQMVQYNLVEGEKPRWNISESECSWKMDGGCLTERTWMTELGKSLSSGWSFEWCTLSSALCKRKSGLKWEFIQTLGQWQMASQADQEPEMTRTKWVEKTRKSGVEVCGWARGSGHHVGPKNVIMGIRKHPPWKSHWISK